MAIFPEPVHGLRLHEPRRLLCRRSLVQDGVRGRAESAWQAVAATEVHPSIQDDLLHGRKDMAVDAVEWYDVGNG